MKLIPIHQSDTLYTEAFNPFMLIVAFEMYHLYLWYLNKYLGEMSENIKLADKWNPKSEFPNFLKGKYENILASFVCVCGGGGDGCRTLEAWMGQLIKYQIIILKAL